MVILTLMCELEVAAVVVVEVVAVLVNVLVECIQNCFEKSLVEFQLSRERLYISLDLRQKLNLL
jgi:hypothetical protein